MVNAERGEHSIMQGQEPPSRHSLPTGERARLATFPERNPNPVFELDQEGRILYANPAATSQFPDLAKLGDKHPLAGNLGRVLAALKDAGSDHLVREIDVGDRVFEERMCLERLGSVDVIRVYAHDVTERRRAEQGIARLARRIVTAQEEERQRVSRELHDEAGQALAALKISLRLLEDEVDDADAIRSGLADAVALVDETREQIRLIAHALRPPSLDALGLNVTLEEFCRDFARRTDLDITYRGQLEVEPPDEVKIVVYRFLQEALANVAVHARARHVEAKMRGSREMIALWVRDDGIGAGSSLLAPRGHGIAGLRERIELLSGTMWVVSHPGKGTHVIARLPLTER